MLDLISHLFRLRIVVEVGSMRGAAERLGVTQPALTRSIAQLERHFGKPLLERHPRGVRPTAFGGRVVASIRRLSRSWELAEADLVEDGSGTRGLMRLSAGPLWRAVVLPTVVTQLQGHYPGLQIEMQSGSFRTTIPDLIEGRVDVVFGGVQIADGPHPRLSRRQFTTVYDRIVARADHPIFANLSGGRLKDPLQVLEYPWIVYSADPVYELETVHGTIERLGRAPEIRIRSESMIATFGFLQKGDYLCVLPEAAVAGISGPSIVPVPVDLGHRMVQSGALFREEMADWPPMLRLLDLCQEYFEELGKSSPAAAH